MSKHRRTLGATCGNAGRVASAARSRSTGSFSIAARTQLRLAAGTRARRAPLASTRVWWEIAKPCAQDPGSYAKPEQALRRTDRRLIGPKRSLRVDHPCCRRTALTALLLPASSIAIARSDTPGPVTHGGRIRVAARRAQSRGAVSVMMAPLSSPIAFIEQNLPRTCKRWRGFR